MHLRIATFLFVSLLLLVLSGCNASSIATQASDEGKPISLVELEAIINIPGPITFEKHLAAKWSINLSGLLNLEHPLALQAGLEDRDEPIELYVYSLSHPSKGIYLVDSGISNGFVSPDKNSDLSFLVRMAMNTDTLKVVKTTNTLVKESPSVVKGVFLTHIHIDHILGVADLPAATAVYTGPGESRLKNATNLFTIGTTDRLLANIKYLNEWQFGPSGIIDIFGDKSVFAIHSPGHSPGSTAYLVRSTQGPQLLIGDATHTRWGWENGVEAGTFSADLPKSAESLRHLLALAQRFPIMKVHPGHQSLTP